MKLSCLVVLVLTGVVASAVTGCGKKAGQGTQTANSSGSGSVASPDSQLSAEGKKDADASSTSGGASGSGSVGAASGGAAVATGADAGSAAGAKSGSAGSAAVATGAIAVTGSAAQQGGAPTGASVPGLQAKLAAPSGIIPVPGAPVPSTEIQKTLDKPAQPVAQAPVVPAGPECFQVTYRHKKTTGHGNEEDCAHHKNLLKLTHSGVNSASLCVRVNGRPVAFQQVKGKANELLVSAIAGPEARIVASYCLGKGKCAAAQDCKIPKDEFMEAIGAGAQDSEGMGKWDSADGRDAQVAKMDAQIRKDMAEIDSGSDIFADWISQEEPMLACKAGEAARSVASDSRKRK